MHLWILTSGSFLKFVGEDTSYWRWYVKESSLSETSPERILHGNKHKLEYEQQCDDGNYDIPLGILTGCCSDYNIG